jgi:hypothetical protein
MEDKNFGIPQISKFITNTDLFDGKEDVAQKYAEKIKAGNYSNLAGYDIKSFNANLARIIKL